MPQDNWEDEDEEKKPESPPTEVQAKPKKKNLAEIIAEKEVCDSLTIFLYSFFRLSLLISEVETRGTRAEAQRARAG